MSQIQLPPHWKVLPLGEVGRIERGKFTHRPRNDPEFYGGNIPFIQTGDVANSDGYIRTYSQTLNEKGLSVSRIFAKGTIVITIAANIGHTGILEFDSAFPDSLIGITPFENIDKDYLNYYLRTQQAELDRQAPRGTQKNINIQFLHPWAVVVPPLPEQFAIAHTLRTIQKAKEARQRELELERERKAALTQHLFTHGTRNEPSQKTKIGEIPESWQVSKLGQLIASGPQNGLYKPASCYGDGVPILRIDAFNSGDIIDTQKLKRLQLSNAELEKYALSEGDIIINRVNGSSEIVGKCALVEQLTEATVFESNMIRFAVKPEELSNNFLMDFLGSNQAREQLRQKARITHQKSLNQQDIKSLLIPLPHISEQKYITDVLLACNRKITALEQEAVFLDELFRAMLEELMTGGLSALPLVEEKALN